MPEISSTKSNGNANLAMPIFSGMVTALAVTPFMTTLDMSM